MDREQIEIRYLEILNEGGDPMEDADIRRAIEEDPGLEAELNSMGSMIDALADASLPEGGASMDREPIDAITKAFEEGLQQGRRADIERPARRGVPAWIPSVAVAATITAFFAGAYLLNPGGGVPVRQSLDRPALMEEQVAQPPASADPRTEKLQTGDDVAARGGRMDADGGKPADARPYRSLEKGAIDDATLQSDGAPHSEYAQTGRNGGDPIVALQAEMRDLKQTVAMSMLESGSPARRMQALEYTAAIDEPDEELIDALGTTLRTDESVTVRLATAETLNRYGSLPTVRQTIIDALLNEKDPLVQLQLIDLLMDVRDAETLKALRSLEQSDETDALVRERVAWALKESR